VQAQRKELNKAKRDAKRARREAAKEAEREVLQARKEEQQRKKEAMKVIVVDGYVVDLEGNRIRPYTRAERFFDNKPLCYSILIAFILLCLLVLVAPWSR
jgi:hypothetical protein